MVASTEYLSRTGRLSFLPNLLARGEVWVVPQWFTAAFGELGPGWIAPAIAAAPDERRRMAISYIITWSTTLLARQHVIIRVDQHAFWLPRHAQLEIG